MRAQPVRRPEVHSMTVRPASERLEEHAREWDVTVEAATKTETSLIASGTHRGQRVILKAVRNESEEWMAPLDWPVVRR